MTGLLLQTYWQLPTYLGPVYHGPAPTSNVLQELHDLGVKVVWNLAAEHQGLAAEESELFQVIWTPIKDFSVPNKQDFLKGLQAALRTLQSGQKLFVHCMAGHGRTGMALAALLVRANGWLPEKALKTAREHCRGPELEEQCQFIIKLFD